MITRVKAIADGILMAQMINERYDIHRGKIENIDDVLDKIHTKIDKESRKKIDKKDLN